MAGIVSLSILDSGMKDHIYSSCLRCVVNYSTVFTVDMIKEENISE